MLDEVSTTCDSVWVDDRHVILLLMLNVEVDPPAIAGGTDLIQVPPPSDTFQVHLPKMPRRFLRVRLILFSALPIQMIGPAALPDLCRQIRDSSPPIIQPRS